MTKIIATLIAAFFAVTVFASDNASTLKTSPAAQAQTAKVMNKNVVQKSKKKKKSKKHSKKSRKHSKKAAATPAQ